MIYNDVLWNVLRVGDVVSYAASIGDSCTLRVGRIDELKISKGRFVGGESPSILLTVLGSTELANGLFRMSRRVTIHGRPRGNGYIFPHVVRLSPNGHIDFAKLYESASPTEY